MQGFYPWAWSILTYNQAWHFKEKAKERIYGVSRDSYTFLPSLYQRLMEINTCINVDYTSNKRNFMHLFSTHAFSIQSSWDVSWY